ncbi:MAG: hypothetical protein E5V60_15565 [Mesorhizobium sp.]|uniref:hypothetical protein n=1 Tax=Mesorhizobium sp. M4A.F.Ca.ET.090.04.2.1 TaxID=2496663 RepID=UPI000FC9D1D0|nr:hypothetical protein [Mesorhizobium sp. M4A.F.Ca.ET.090.04.2.1]RVC42595.1 hypothetical protein EN781_21670 [Mesorhizobium sp. M4A.F.Ca.ET.090.04.2.1]TIW65594.1 MAG: hypothetical protein E5V60_15565 [Mesorhizobium sp.]
MYELTLSATPDGIKFAKLGVAFDAAMEHFRDRPFARPLRRATFNFDDANIQIFSGYDDTHRNVRTTFWVEKNYCSYHFLIDARELMTGKRVVAVGSVGGPNDANIVSGNNYFFVGMDETIVHTLDEKNNHGFAMTGPNYVAELLDRLLQPWKSYSVEPQNKLQPVTPEIARALVRLGYRSKDATTWAAPGANIGNIQ